VHGMAMHWGELVKLTIDPGHLANPTGSSIHELSGSSMAASKVTALACEGLTG